MKLSNTAKFGFAGPKRRAHQVGGLRIVRGDLARGALDAEDLADHEVGALLGVLAHDALIVVVGDVLGPFVGDVAAVLGGIERLVHARDPLLLHRHRIDRGDLDRPGLGLRESRAARRRQGGKPRTELQDRTAGQERVSHGVPLCCDCPSKAQVARRR